MGAQSHNVGTSSSPVTARSGASWSDTLDAGSVRGHGVEDGSDAELEEAVPQGSTIGRYHVLGRVGSGGMGVVFAAYDPDLDRRVALKVLRASVRRSRGASEGRARLLREAQAMAKVQHENVIAVHDVGMIDDRVFIAMEFIDGETVGDWVALRNPDRARIMEVYRAAGRGLAAAHARGLVHRDFKPDNVLLGADGRVCVVDFGLARVSGPRSERAIEVTVPGDPAVTEPGIAVAALDEPDIHGADTRRLRDPLARATPPPPAAAPPRAAAPSDLTRTGAMVGTPAYMAPEQHLGAPATERSDQFSFCVSLYEALYGQRPFAGSNHTQLVVNLSEGNIRPAPADSQVPGWLRRVLMRGLSVDPAARFESMEALLAALVRSTVARRRAVFGGVGALGATASLGLWLGVATDAESRCARASERAEAVWGDAERARFSEAFLATGKPYARDAWTGVAAALDEYTAAWSAARVEACEATHVRGEQSAALLDLRMVCLDGRLDAVAAVTSLFETADADVVAGALDAVQALPSLDACSNRAQLARQGHALADPGKRAAVAGARRQLRDAAAMLDAHRVEAGLQIATAVLHGARALQDHALHAEALLAVADAKEAAGDLEGGRESLRAALLLAERHGEAGLIAQAWLGLLWIDGYRNAQAQRGRDAADHARAWIDRMGGDRELAVLLKAREGDLSYVVGQYERSESEHRDALALRLALDGPDHPRTADSHTGIGHALVERAMFTEALSHYDEALAIFERNYGPRHPHLAHALTNVGVTQEYLGELAAARATHEQALDIAEAAYGPEHSTVAEVVNNYAAVLHAQGELALAATHFERARRIWERSYGAAHPDVGMAVFNLAIVAEDAGTPERALALHREALAIRERAHGSAHPDVAESQQHIAVLSDRARLLP